ncbi:peptide/nickel transport system permease protein [Diaminobutyricimonas aerilata]|uniref:Peptide/nickel transport system permease protein n=1 Tax=Diaminobutyricimonas aerilata TaxID=1162967 RepID=A0A2M9CFC6_9MICO|nr:ABC transporter permease [Diaminobutyricimonas aerilata]PJJ70589.1 peptide/nickel transport system permease protein [Diaminobutyricimonas aerilata]
MTFTPTNLEVEATPGGDPALEESLASPPASGRRLLRAFLRDVPAVLSSVYILLVILMALLAPLIVQISGWSPYEFDQSAIDPNMGAIPIGPLGGVSAEHWFGVEPGSGRDIFARIVYGAQVSMTVALSATLLTGILGVVLGLLAGYFGGFVDTVISRVMEFLMAFPALIFMIAILSALPSDNRIVLLVLVISLFGWPYLARIIRAQTLSLKEREFVEAARASGATSAQIVFREILPNLRSTIIVMTTLAVPGYIGTEAGLSFLGVGVVPPTPSWGQMIAAAASWYAVDPMYFIIPGSFLFLLVLSFTTLGDRIRALVGSGEARA